jgi:hypothetical protein
VFDSLLSWLAPPLHIIIHLPTSSYRPSLNSSLIACFSPLNPQSPFSGSNPGTPKNSSMASSGLSLFICFAL